MPADEPVEVVTNSLAIEGERVLCPRRGVVSIEWCLFCPRIARLDLSSVPARVVCHATDEVVPSAHRSSQQ